jgi:hypothetical protein
MSITLYRKLQKSGLGPRETVVGATIIILPEDERAWDDARRNPTDTEKKLIERTRQRWHKRALKAGAAAVKSPNHVSKLKIGRSKRPSQRKRSR